MDISEQLAFAVLSSGGSFKEAAEASKLPVKDVMRLWEQSKRVRMPHDRGQIAPIDAHGF